MKLGLQDLISALGKIALAAPTDTDDR